MGYRVVVTGAAGNMGREVLKLLAERDFPADEVAALGSARMAGKEISFGEETILKLQDVARFDFRGWDVCFLTPGAGISPDTLRQAAAQGCVVIDVGGQLSGEAGVPVVVPEVNANSLAKIGAVNMVSNPGAATIPLVMALKPLHDVVPIRRVVLATYQSVSGAGKEAMDELYTQTRAHYVFDPIKPDVLPRQIAFNLFPQTSGLLEDGSAEEERALIEETRKIIGAPIQIAVTCVRVPVFIGYALAVHVEFEQPMEARAAREILEEAPGIVVLDRRREEEYMTPIETAGEDMVYVSRIRKDPSVPHGIGLWIVTDNMRKGSALNAVQIAEILAAEHL